MKSNYAHKLNNANIILGIHIAFKLVVIFILFIVLYTTIWIKEIYLTIIKSSVYFQIFIFLSLSIVMISINNPKSFDICSTFINYFYLIVSILELGIIICEIYFLIQNLQNFINVFHECPYYRTYEEISNKEYKRTCLYYITDYNNELPYKYICYYNSENEYYNEFCDGFICEKNKNINEINSYVKCFGNVDRNSIHFDRDNEFYLKEVELINRYKTSNLYACFRKEKLIKNENIFNNKCPDSNPIKKMLIFIYTDIVLHFLIDFLFIYEFILIRKIKEIYSNLVLLQSRAPINYLVNEEELRSENNSNKQTFNTDNKELLGNPQSLNTFNLQRENTQTIIIEPEFNNNYNNIKNNDINKIQENDNTLNKNYKNQINQLDNIEVNYNENNKDNDNFKETNENSGIINRQSKIFKKNKRKKNKGDGIKINKEENINNKIDYTNYINGKNSSQRMIIVDVKNDEEYDINRMNFFIRKKSRKKSNRNNVNKEQINNIYTISNEDINTLKTTIKGNNKDDIQIADNKKCQKINVKNLKKKIDFKISDNNELKNDILNDIDNEQKNNIVININKNNNNKTKKILRENIIRNDDIKNKSNIIGKNNNNLKMGFKKLSENNLFSKDNKNNSGYNINQISLKNEITNNLNKNKNKNNDKTFNEEKNNRKNNSIDKKEIKEDKKEIKNDKKNEIEKAKKLLLDNIHINSEIFLTDEELEKREQDMKDEK